MKTYTIEQFRKEYPNDAVCLDKIFNSRFGTLEGCPSCGVADVKFRRITTRQCYQCPQCYFQIYPCAGTIFEKSTTPLTYWFYAIHLFTVSRNGVAAKELERVLGITYKTAWRMAKSIRALMGEPNTPKLKGTVEIDETYVGGVVEHKERKPMNGKTPVFAMVERQGNVRAETVKNAQKETLLPIIEKNVDKTAKVMTDENKAYVTLDTLGYFHESIRHQMKQYRWGECSTNTIEGFFSQLKRSLRGTYIHVSPKYLQNYVDEVVFRYNNRKVGEMMFDTLISRV